MIETDVIDYDEDNTNVTEDVVTEQVQHELDSDGFYDSGRDDEIEESAVEEPDVLRFQDVGYLEFDRRTKLSIISQHLRGAMITLGSGPFQHQDNLPSVPGERSITSAWFKRRLANGEEVNRSWLLYSPINEAAYCFCCLLFTSSSSNARSSFELADGFNKWKKSEKLQLHESSPSHRTAFTTWKEAERRINDGTGIDAELQAEIRLEKQRWRDILYRILDCIKFLISQNLALRDHEENVSAADDRMLETFYLGSNSFLSMTHCWPITYNTHVTIDDQFRIYHQKPRMNLSIYLL